MNTEELYNLLSKPIDDKTYELLRKQVWVENGLVSDKIRKQVWPLFLGIQIDEHKVLRKYTKHFDQDHQIDVDIERSVNHLDRAQSLSKQQIKSIREDMRLIIRDLFIEEKGLNYYQGYHDIVEFFYYIGGKEWCFQMMKPFSYLILYDNLTANPLYLLFLLYNVFNILTVHDRKLVDFILNLDSEPPIYLFSFFNTLFAHDITNTQTLSRLFDILLVSHPLLILYVIAAVLIYKKDEIMNSSDPLFYLRSLKQNLQDEHLPIEAIIKETQFLYSQLPPSQLIATYNSYYPFIPNFSIFISYDNLFTDTHHLDLNKLYNVDTSQLSDYTNSISLDTFNRFIYVNRKHVGFTTNNKAENFLDAYFPSHSVTRALVATSGLALGVTALIGIAHLLSKSD